MSRRHSKHQEQLAPLVITVSTIAVAFHTPKPMVHFNFVLTWMIDRIPTTPIFTSTQLKRWSSFRHLLELISTSRQWSFERWTVHTSSQSVFKFCTSPHPCPIALGQQTTLFISATGQAAPCLTSPTAVSLNPERADIHIETPAIGL